jgi:hypothetical protein
LKWLQVKNTLAYSFMELTVAVKSFIVLAPREPYLLKRSFLSLVLHILNNNIKLYSTMLINKNTLAYSFMELTMSVKSFIVQSPREPYLLKRSFLSLVLHTLKNNIKLYSTMLINNKHSSLLHHRIIMAIVYRLQGDHNC